MVLKDFGPRQLATLALTAHALAEGISVGRLPLHSAYERGCASGVKELTKMLHDLEESFPADHQALADATSVTALEAASTVLQRLFERLQMLRRQLRAAVGSESQMGSETQRMQAAVRSIELTVSPPSEELTPDHSDRQQLQIKQACQRRLRPSFEHLVYSQLSSRQQHDLGAIDPMLMEVAGEL